MPFVTRCDIHAIRLPPPSPSSSPLLVSPFPFLTCSLPTSKHMPYLSIKNFVTNEARCQKVKSATDFWKDADSASLGQYVFFLPNQVRGREGERERERGSDGEGEMERERWRGREGERGRGVWWRQGPQIPRVSAILQTNAHVLPVVH